MKEKGISMILAIFLFTILLGIALGIIHLTTRQIQILQQIGYSINAFYIADSGLEKALQEIIQTNSFSSSGSIGGGNYNIYCECCDKDLNSNCLNTEPSCPTGCPMASSTSPCHAFNFCLRSVGSYLGVSQSIQIEY
jgi:hypothetical protein